MDGYKQIGITEGLYHAECTAGHVGIGGLAMATYVFLGQYLHVEIKLARASRRGIFSCN